MSGRRGPHTHRGGRPSRLRRRRRLRGGVTTPPGLDLPGLDAPDVTPETPPAVEPPVIDPPVTPPEPEPPGPAAKASAKLVLGAVAVIAMLYWFFRRKT